MNDSELVALGGPAYRLAARILRSAGDAEDVVQQAYLATLRQIRAGSSPRELRTWFLKVAANAARERLRGEANRAKREAAMMAREASVGRGGAPASEHSPELLDALRVAMDELEEKYRLPVALCHEEGLSQREAAAVLDIPRTTLAERLSEGLSRLRERLRGAGYSLAPMAIVGALAHTAPAMPASLTGAIGKLVFESAVVGKAGLAATSAAAKGGLAMKIGLGVAAIGLAAGATLLAAGGRSGEQAKPQSKAAPEAAEKPVETPAGAIPLVVLDEGAPNWVVDRFAGNSAAVSEFFQGPARQTGGLGTSRAATAPDGSVFVTCGFEHKSAPNLIARVAPDGTLRLVAGGGASLADGPAGMAFVRAGDLCYSPAEKSLYFVHRTIPCVRRLYEKDGQWLVANVAGDPEKAGLADGQGKAALFSEPRSLTADSKGAIYLLDGTGAIRKIADGQVSTVAKLNSGPKAVDGPMDQAVFHITKMSGGISMGESDDVLYVADHMNRMARRIYLKTMQVSTVAGMPGPDDDWGTRRKPSDAGKRYNANTDGPAMTHASFNSGCAWVMWDARHKALWLGGPDEHDLRWLKDGWVKTVLNFNGGVWREANSVGLKPEDVKMNWVVVKAVDDKGGVYFAGASEKSGLWRACEKGEVKP